MSNLLEGFSILTGICTLTKQGYRGGNRIGARNRNVGWRIDYFVVSEDLATLSVRQAFIRRLRDRPLPSRADSCSGLASNFSMKESEKAFFETLELARKGWGNTHPNPMVGAVIGKAVRLSRRDITTRQVFLMPRWEQ